MRRAGSLPGKRAPQCAARSYSSACFGYRHASRATVAAQPPSGRRAEETGIVIGSAAVPLAHLRDWGMRNVYEIYPVWRHRYAPGVTHNTEHVFGLRVPRDIAITLAPREHTRSAWLPWREAADRHKSGS